MNPLPCLLRWLFLPLLCLCLAAPVGAEEHGAHDEVALRSALGMVRQVVPGATPEERLVTVDVSSGYGAGQAVTVVQRAGGPGGMELPVVAGDRVVLSAVPLEEAEEFDWQIVDYQRANASWILAALTVLAFLLVGGGRGLKTLAVLLVTVLAIAGILLPLTLRGWSPLPLAVLLASAIALATTLLTAGAGRKAWAAVAGTSGAVLVSAVLAALFVTWGRLSGLANEDSVIVHGAQGAVVDAPGLLAASMLVGALGIMLDLSLSISSAVDELRQANPNLPRKALFAAGWQVGRDLLSTTSNTLLLAYLGGFLPVLLNLAVHPLPWLRVQHLETVGAFSVTLLVGLAGLLAVIPLTALAALSMHPASPRLLEESAT
ncbi:MAG: YibE/F family protein [Candidatus Sericytochromatia bacterium]|nr:YibE/F family protein [Candidatus Sericytochromatia bacterium]